MKLADIENKVLIFTSASSRSDEDKPLRLMVEEYKRILHDADLFEHIE